MKPAFCCFGALLFFAFAFLQFNDASQYGNHDPWIWIAIYSCAGGLNLWAFFGDVSRSILLIWCGFNAGALLFRMQDDQGNLHLDWLNPSAYFHEGTNQMVQHTNESGGLIVVLVWALLQLFLGRQKA